MNKIKYIVKPEAGVVVGILEVDLEEYLNSMLEQMSPYLRSIAYNALQNDDYPWGLDHYTIKAIARCADDDDFDEVFGKKLVEARIYKKLHKKIANALYRASEKLDKIRFTLNAEKLVHNIKAYEIQKDLEEYFKTEG